MTPLKEVVRREMLLWKPAVAHVWLEYPNAYLAGALRMDVVASARAGEVLEALDSALAGSFAWRPRAQPRRALRCRQLGADLPHGPIEPCWRPGRQREQPSATSAESHWRSRLASSTNKALAATRENLYSWSWSQI